MIKISKKDLFWGYFAQIFSVASGLITLPLILRLLNAEEIGMNYLMLTLGSLVALFDFGFSAQFSRNITYVFSGAQFLKKEGIVLTENDKINYQLLSTMIDTARFIYKRLAFFVLTLMLSFGTIYIYFITDGFTKVNNSFPIWVMFSLGTFFNIFYSYYSSLLMGNGLVMESNKAIVYSKLVNVILTFFFLILGWRLLGVVLANLIAPFVSRYISHFYFFTKDITDKINNFQVSKQEKLELFQILWYNSKKIGLVFIGSYAINKFSLFIAGIFLSLQDVASYGLMLQLFGLLTTVSSVIFTVSQPRFASLRTKNDNRTLVKEFAFTMSLYYFTFIIGTLFLLCFGYQFLYLINSKVSIPNFSVMLLFAIVLFLEGNHSNFATLIVTKNNVPFVKSSLIAGFFIALGDFLVLYFTSLGLLGLVLVQGGVQLVYANWKWPYEVFREFRISVISFVKLGIRESFIRIKLL